MSFLKSVFSEPDEKGSFTRIATALLILAALGWVTRLVWINHALPDFGGITLFVGTLYGLNKAGTLANTIAENKAECPPTPPKI
jgi:hypothetical protein